MKQNPKDGKWGTLKRTLSVLAKPQEVDPKELKMGIEVEKEHTDNKHAAEKIARDHLAEHPDYYTRLKNAGL